MKGTGESHPEACHLKHLIFNAKNDTKIGTWNVRTLYQTGKLGQVLKEMRRYKLEILGISELRWTGQGRIKSENVTILFSGHATQHAHGVGMLLDQKATNALIAWKPINDRIMMARFQTQHAKVSIIQVYAPAETADENDKDDFYNTLQDTLDNTPAYDVKLLMGDLNAHLSKDRAGFDREIGPYGSSESINTNGSRLLSFCQANNLCIGNTFFSHKTIHKKHGYHQTLKQKMKSTSSV